MLNIVRRRGYIVVLAAITTAAVAYFVGSSIKRSYSAEALAVVSASRTLTPDQANRLALTYAVLVPKDVAIARFVARALNTTPSEVLRRISVFNDPETAILRVEYRGTSPANAQAGARAVVEAISGRNPASPNIGPGTIGVVRLPTAANSTRKPTTLLAIGLVLGLALGALLLVASERADPRIDDADELARELGCPTSSLEGISGAAGTALLERWRKLGGRPRRKVALLAANASAEQHVRTVAAKLARADTTHRTRVVSNVPAPITGEPVSDGVGSVDGRNGEPALFTGGVPGSEAAGERVALACDLTVLIVQRGTRRVEVRSALDVLRQFDISPAWAILVSVSKHPLRDASSPTRDAEDSEAQLAVRSSGGTVSRASAETG